MDWALFWTIILQIVLGCLICTLPLAGFVYMMGLAFGVWPTHMLRRFK